MITRTKLHSIFDRIIDEGQSFYFDDTQRDGFLNDAQLAVFKSLYNPDAPSEAPGLTGYYETSSKISQYLQPFKKQISGTVATAGVLTRAEVDALAGRTHFVISGLQLQYDGIDSFKGADWRTESEISAQIGMPFYMPSRCEPQFTIVDTGYNLYPEDIAPDFKCVALVYPLDISAAQDCEFPEALANQIAFKAAELAAMSTRDNDFLQFIRQEIEKIGV